MQIGSIPDGRTVAEYTRLIDSAIVAAEIMRHNPTYEEFHSEIEAVLCTLQKIRAAAEQGKVDDAIAGMTKFASDWSIEGGRLTSAIYEVEDYFRRKLFDEDSYRQAMSKEQG